MLMDGDHIHNDLGTAGEIEYFLKWDSQLRELGTPPPTEE